MAAVNGDAADRPLARCAYHQPPRDDCTICDVIRRGLVPIPMVVVRLRRPLTLRRVFASRWWPMLGGAIAGGVGAPTIAGWFGASSLLQFGCSQVGAIAGMLLVAWLLDRRRLHRRRLPLPPRSTLPEQIHPAGGKDDTD